MDCPKCCYCPKGVEAYDEANRLRALVRTKACRFRFETLECIAQIPEVGEIGYKGRKGK